MGLFDKLLGREQYEYVENYVPDEIEERGAFIPFRQPFVVNEITALQLIPVTRCISVLETAAMQIPVEVVRGIEKVDSPSWLVTPDVENNVTQAEFIGQTIVSMAIYGNAYWKIYKGARGISNMELIPANWVNIEQDTRGNLTYSINGVKQAKDSIKHLKLWSVPGDIYGQGPLQRHKSIIQSANDLQNYADNWFKVAAVPTGTLTTSEFLSADIALANKKAFIDSQKERSVAVLSSGLQYNSIALNPEEAQFLANQTFTTRQIANMFGVPSMYLGLSVEGSGLTYTNGNEDRQKLYEDGLQQYIVRIQQALTDLLPRGQKAEFNMTGFLRPNVLNRYQSYAIGIDKRFLTVNEVRESEGMPPIKASDLPPIPQPVVANNNPQQDAKQPAV
jgi:HK97 family phage portal protein